MLAQKEVAVEDFDILLRYGSTSYWVGFLENVHGTQRPGLFAFC